MAASGCVLFAAVHTDFDHKADFGKYHTYSWLGVRAGNPLWQDRITQAVDAALTAKGWSKVESGGEAAVSAVGQTSERDTTEVIPERVGNLTVDIFGLCAGI